LQRLIVEPARLAGLRFEEDERTGKRLDELILQDASHDPSALPLLQYALSELYFQRDETTRTLTFAAYEKLGGVEGALGRRAADTFQSLPKEVQAALPEILPLLVTVDTAGEQAAVRRRASMTELTRTLARRVLTETLIAARFLTTDRQDTDAIVSLAHEALLRRWPHLAEWVSANRDQLRLRARVEQNQKRWEQDGREPSLLLNPGLPLEEGRQLLNKAAAILSRETARFIRASIDWERSRKLRRRRVIITIITMITLLVTVIISMLVVAVQFNFDISAAQKALMSAALAKAQLEKERDFLQYDVDDLEKKRKDLEQDIDALTKKRKEME
jgi:hypothetical protein